MNLILSVSAKDYGFFPHGRHEKIPWFADLALMADEQPSPGEQLLLFLGVNFGVDENFPANNPGFQINQGIFVRALAARLTGCCHVGLTPRPRDVQEVLWFWFGSNFGSSHLF